jgi:phosphoribosyl-ATP pyrophosphohydrolase/phosphoribosyl-AMP cyclohydrolase
MDGKAVQLIEGKEKVLEKDNPLELAHDFDRFGEIAVIDLDAAMGKGNNLSLIKQLCQRAECRVGGGIRSVTQAKELVSYGASKIIIGSKAFENDALNIRFLEELANAIGKERIIAAVDARNREIVTRGWRHATGLDLFETAELLEPYVYGLLFTCVEKEGHLQGTDLETIKQLRKVFSKPLTAAGGIQSLEEIEVLSKIDTDIQLGMALYTEKINLTDAFVCSLPPINKKFCGGSRGGLFQKPPPGLFPVVATDRDGQALMVAYANDEALRKTFETGNMWYYSRSRRRLWMKGETSGNVQKFIRFRADCDRDTLVAVVEQTGVACHLGDYSCFGQKRFSLNELYGVITKRFADPRAGSYTATLDQKKVREKLMEEAQEVVAAETRQEVIWEAADVLYFLTVLLQKEGVTPDEVLNELYRRRHTARRNTCES